MSNKLDAESYLRSGSNEVRVLEYRVADMAFGINILKVNKIVAHLADFTSVPETHHSIKGVFRDMDRLVPVVDLAGFLGIADENTQLRKVIVTEFFGIQTGFWVDTIDWIHHFKWEDVIDANGVFSGIEQKYVIGLVKPSEDRMVQLLDYETILLDLCPHLQTATDRGEIDASFRARKVLVAEDSPAVRSMLVNELIEMGGEVVEASDGAQAWEAFQQQEFDLVICDVEMPQMDGLAVTLRIRQSERPDTPVIVYSSIGDIGMKARGKFLKADAHITKLNLEKLLITADKLMRGEKIEAAFEEEEELPELAEAVETVPLDV